jgi:hypothetical protein
MALQFMPTVEVLVRDAPRETEINITRIGQKRLYNCATDATTGTGVMFNVMPGTYKLRVARNEGDGHWFVYEHRNIVIPGVKRALLTIGNDGRRRGQLV